jgi:SNF2 family DNA or RNA helicase
MAFMQSASDARPRRAAAVARFQTELPEESRYVLASLKAGGVGVTLTAANHAIGVVMVMVIAMTNCETLAVMEPWWNPTTELQVCKNDVLLCCLAVVLV